MKACSHALIVIWLVRLGIVSLVLFWARVVFTLGLPKNSVGLWLSFAGALLLSTALVCAFSKGSVPRIFLAAFILIVPSAAFIGVDLIVLRLEGFQWLALPLQLAVPFTFGYCLLRDAEVKRLFQRSP